MAAEGVSEFVSKQLSDIANQLGQTTSALEAVREDIKDESVTSRVFRENMISRIDNIAIRMGEAETSIAATKKLLDEDVMPLVTENNKRKLMISGALKVWGLAAALVGGLSAVFWDRVLILFLYVTGHGPVQ